MEQDLFATFKPDGDALLRRISQRIDDHILEYIAGMDPIGGAERIAAILGELRKIRDQDPMAEPWIAGIVGKRRAFYEQDTVGRPFPIEPLEVMEFTSSSEPDAAARSRGELPGTRGHWARAFACAALMRAYGDEYISGTCTGIYNPRLIQLLESLRVLDAGFEPETMAFLAWFILRLTADELAEDERVFAGIGLLWAAARSGHTVPDAAVVALSQWLIAEEQRLFQESGVGRGEFPGHWSAEEQRDFAVTAGARNRRIRDHWLFRTTNTMWHGKWITLGAELAAFGDAGPRGDAVRAVGRRLAGQAA